MRRARPLAQITAEAMRILYREIGIVDTLRFVNQYTAGYGDYTSQREELFAGMTLDNIVSEIKQSRRRGRPRRGEKTQHKKTAVGKRIPKPRARQHKST